MYLVDCVSTKYIFTLSLALYGALPQDLLSGGLLTHSLPLLYTHTYTSRVLHWLLDEVQRCSLLTRVRMMGILCIRSSGRGRVAGVVQRRPPPGGAWRGSERPRLELFPWLSMQSIRHSGHDALLTSKVLIKHSDLRFIIPSLFLSLCTLLQPTESANS